LRSSVGTFIRKRGRKLKGSIAQKPDCYKVKEILLQALAEYHQIPFLETSAKTGLNVEEAFTVISQLIYDKIKVRAIQIIFLNVRGGG
jgi:hypothetical protein